MERLNNILCNKEFKTYLSKTMEVERDRVFCRHDLDHFMSVARIAYIMNLERNLSLSKEIIYSSALLHDIGRFMEYKNNIPHDEASGDLAPGILKECGFHEEEINIIVGAIKNHRNPHNLKDSLNEIIYLSDKASRSCFSCSVVDECRWSREKKNLKILI